MAKRLILIHGRNFKPPEAELRENWLRALARGIEHASGRADRLDASDLAIDFAEDVGPLDPGAVHRIVEIFEAAGARAKISSIHVNGWFGAHDKLTTSLHLLDTAFGLGPGAVDGRVAFIGDSPNDAPMFARFPLSFGVANLAAHGALVDPPPRWITAAARGAGFVELADALLAARE